MAQQEEPLYDFPEPTQPLGQRFVGHHRGQGSLKSISVLDRLLLTVPVWFQLSINPATALHILQREPPGTFLVRKSRTSQRNVLCVRLADDSVPSFVQQFGIREEQSTLSLETSAISFPDLPRLVSFYCVSRDVLPFPLELPEAIAKATSHKELESISHMGIEFWNSHLNVRGPREAPKPPKDQEKKPDSVSTTSPGPAPQTSASPQSDPAPLPDPDTLSNADKDPGSTLFHEFCPIKTRSPRELDCGSGQGALCFINPLFLQLESPLLRRRMFKRSLKVRVSTETSTLLSPPLAPPPPPPLLPKAKGKSKALPEIQGQCKASQIVQDQTGDNPSEPPTIGPHLRLEEEEQSPAQASSQVPATMEQVPDNSDYMQPSPVISSSHCPSLSPYVSPSAPSMTPPAFPKASPSLSPRGSPRDSPSRSPYQSPSLSPKILSSLSLHGSANTSPSLSPYQFPSPSPLIAFSTSPCASQAFPPFTAPSRIDQQGSDKEDEEAIARVDSNYEDAEINGEDGQGLALEMEAEGCYSDGRQERAAKSSPLPQNNGTKYVSECQ